MKTCKAHGVDSLMLLCPLGITMLLSISLSIFPSVCQSHASGSNMVYLGAMITIEHQ